MKKLFTMLFALLILAACSTNSDNDNNNQNNEDNQKSEDVTENEAEQSALKVETLFDYNFEERGEYEIQAIKTDSNGKAITFTGLEEIDRSSEYFTYVINQNDEVFEAVELAEDEEQDRRCTDLHLSPNGDYLAYNCHDDGVELSIYDMNAEQTIHQMEESDDYVTNVHGISNDKVIYYEVENDDYQVELVVYNAEANDNTHYVIEDLIDSDDDRISIDDVIQSDDGNYLLINTLTSLHLFDVENESAEEIVNVDSYVEEYDAEMFIFNAEMSPDAKYVYYNIHGAGSESVYNEFFFHNLESDDVTVYGRLDYNTVSGFDDDYNVLLKGDEQLFLYNAESEETKIVPDIEMSSNSRYVTLSRNGDYIIYTDSDSNDDDTYTQSLFRVSLGDTSNFETTELDVQAEKETAEAHEDGIVLTDDNFEEKELFLDLMDESTSVMYPTDFPNKIGKVTHHLSGNIDDRRYGQSITMESESSLDDELRFSATPLSSNDTCVGFDDLDLVDTIDGNDYYFYEYKNDDVVAGVSVDGICYDFESEEHSEEVMLDIAQSLETIDEPLRELSLDDLKFPTLFPMSDPYPSHPHITAFNDEDKTDFQISYYTDKDNPDDNDIQMQFEIRSHEPRMFDHTKNKSVDIDGFDEAYLLEDLSELLMYDGNHYYIVELKINNDIIEAYGAENIEEIFIEIGNSLE